MPRKCTTCQQEPGTLASIEHAVAAGQSIASVARRYGLSADALGRHVQRHLAPAIRDAARESRVIDLGSVAKRVATIADDARAAREAAQAAGRTADAVRAGDAELRALAALSERLGIDDGETVAALAEGEALFQAVAATVWKYPDVGRALASAIRDDATGPSVLADSLDTLADRAALTPIQAAPLAALTA